MTGDDGGFTGRERTFAAKASPIPGGDGPRAGIAPLCSALVRPIELLGPGWAHQCGMDIAVARHKSATKINAIIFSSDVKMAF